jgi:hypothetical protein
MKASLAKAWRLIKHFLGFLLIFWFAFTIYCIFSIPQLCDLKKENPKTTAFQERRKKQWEKKKVKRKIVKIWVPLTSISSHLKCGTHC